MQQYSHEGTPIKLETLSGHLLFIDPLYLDDIKDHPDRLLFQHHEANPASFIQRLEEQYFPYGGGTLLGYRNVKANSTFYLAIDSIIHFDHADTAAVKQAIAKTTTVFGSDFGAILIMDMSNFDQLVALLTSDDLVDATESNFAVYTHQINTRIGNCGWAYIQNPGTGAGVDFIGSGAYCIPHPTHLPHID